MTTGRAAILATVARNSALRRIIGGFLLSSAVEWASWLALLIFAYGHGGSAEAGVVGFVTGIPVIVVAPAAALIGDRWPRAWVVVASFAVLTAFLAASAILLAAGVAIAAYALGIGVVSLFSIARPAVASLLPEVSTSPDELTAANVASGISEGAGALGGPLAAGALLAVGDAPLVLAVCAAAMALAVVAVVPVARAARRMVLTQAPAAPLGVAGSVRALGRELAGGASAVLADRRLTAVFALLAASIGVLGALGVLVLVIAIDVLGLDEDAAGYLTAAGGLGALIGSALSATLVGRERLGVPLIVATVLFGVAVAALAVTTEPVAIGLVLVGTGIGWSYAYVASTTITQRLAGDDVMTRVFGVAESVQTGAESLGGLLVPVLVLAVGPAGALAWTGVGLGVVAVLAAPTLLRADRLDPAFVRDLRIVRGVGMFAALSGPVVERLTTGAHRLSVAPDQVIIRAGEIGDRFYVIVDGTVGVEVGGRPAGTLGAGQGFGEIALLRDVPRTATVRALDPCELLVIEREPFLEALTGQPRSRAMATDLAARRLAADEAASPAGGPSAGEPSTGDR